MKHVKPFESFSHYSTSMREMWSVALRDPGFYIVISIFGTLIGVLQ